MSRGQAHSAEMRAQVLAALLAGQSINQVARDFKLGPATVSTWRNESGLGSNAFRIERVAENDLGGLVLGYLRASLKTAQVQVELFGDEKFLREWLKNQPASEAALLYGGIVDKALRLLEAFERAAEPEPEPTEQPA